MAFSIWDHTMPSGLWPEVSSQAGDNTTKTAVNTTLDTNDSLMDLTLMRRNKIEIGINSIVLLILAITALLGNSLVIVAIYSSGHLRSQISNILIINLSVSDIISAFGVMMTSFLAVALDVEYIHPVWCNTCCILNYICIIVSMLTLAFISMDRYVAIIHALSYTLMVTKNKLLVLVGYSWVQGIAFAAAPAILNWIHYDYWEAICAIDWHQDKRQATLYVIVACVVCFLVPGVIMIIAYTFIIREARKIGTVIPQNGNSGPQQDIAAKKAAKTIKSLLIVVLFFFVCMTPFCITKLLKVVSYNKNLVPTYANLTAAYFQFISSCINPFIYAIFRADFKFAFKRIIQKLVVQNDLDNTGTYTSSIND